VLRRILPDQASVEWIDPSARVCMIERAVPTGWAGRKVSELEVPEQAKVVALGRLGVAQVPTADLVAQEGDLVYVAVAGDSIDAYEAFLAAPPTGRH
jgi:trk system potassium uptake protein TrkA